MAMSEIEENFSGAEIIFDCGTNSQGLGKDSQEFDTNEHETLGFAGHMELELFTIRRNCYELLDQFCIAQF